MVQAFKHTPESNWIQNGPNLLRLTSGRRRSDPESVQNRQMSRERDRALWDP